MYPAATHASKFTTCLGSEVADGGGNAGHSDRHAVVESGACTVRSKVALAWRLVRSSATLPTVLVRSGVSPGGLENIEK